MTVIYDWYTTYYWHVHVEVYVAVYATLITKATVDNKPFTFNWS